MIIPFLLQRRHSTFFSRDEGFYDRRLCHARYSLVYLAVDKYEAAIFVRRVLRHPELDSQANGQDRSRFERRHFCLASAR